MVPVGSVMAVRIIPGQTALTRIFLDEKSTAQDLAKALIPALVMSYTDLASTWVATPQQDAQVLRR